jgi:hypothetical protein
VSSDLPQRRRHVPRLTNGKFALVQLWPLDILHTVPPPQLRPEAVHRQRTRVTGVELLVATRVLKHGPLAQVAR